MPVHISPLQGQKFSQPHAGPECSEEKRVMLRVVFGTGFEKQSHFLMLKWVNFLVFDYVAH